MTQNWNGNMMEGPGGRGSRGVNSEYDQNITYKYMKIKEQNKK